MLVMLYLQCLARALRAAHLVAWDETFLVHLDHHHQAMLDHLQARAETALGTALRGWGQTFGTQLLDVFLTAPTSESPP